MKKYILAFSVLALLLQACNNEDDLTPSNDDTDRAIELADMSKPLVAELVENFNCGLMYEYDYNLDFRYTAEGISQTDKWNGVKFPTILDDRFIDTEGDTIASLEYTMKFPDYEETVYTYDEHIDAALNFMDTTLYQYFMPNTPIAELFPNKVLLAAKITAGKETGIAALTESDSRVSSSTASKALRSIYNRNSIIFSGNMKDIAPDWEKFKKENFYVFIVRMMDMHNLYDEFPNELFTGVEAYYGDTIGYEYGLESPYKTTTIPTEWYQELGFIDTRYFNKYQVAYSTTGEGSVTSSSGFGSSHRVRARHMFLSNREEDIKSFLNEFIHRSATSTSRITGWDDLPENLRERARGMADVFISLGIDLRAFNPEIESLYQ